MPCTSPTQGWESRELSVNGKILTTFNPLKARHEIYKGKYFIPDDAIRFSSCGHCTFCRMSYGSQWAVRMIAEADLHDHGRNCAFITLTYENKFIPPIYDKDGLICGYGDIDYKHFSDFMKRLRKAIAKPYFLHLRSKFRYRFPERIYWKLAYAKNRIRYYMAAEYGSKTNRPHYHAIIFGYNFPDKYLFATIRGNKLYRSPFLESVWTVPRGKRFSGSSYGYSSIGSVTHASCGYVARYMMKKAKLPGDDRYMRVNPITGELHYVQSEQARMSRQNGGIGSHWFHLNKDDIYVKDFFTFDGKKFKPPKFFDRLLEKVDSKKYEDIKLSRELLFDKLYGDITPVELARMDKFYKYNANKLIREISSEKVNELEAIFSL